MKSVRYTVLFFLWLPALVMAGATCSEKQLTAREMTLAITAGSHLSHQLDKTKGTVALIARSGRDISKYGMRFSHMGIAVKDFNGHKGWSVVHLLNECGTTHSSIYQQGLINFFSDDMYRYDYQITRLNKDLDQRLLSHLDRASREKFHGRRYSMTAYPFSARYQNSNQWVLEMLAYSMHKDARDRVSAQRALWRKHYRPTVINITAFEKLATSFDMTIRLDDHPRDEHRYGRYSIVSVKSIVQYLKRQKQVRSNHIYS